ncbi:hypothetical protein [Chlamydia vaughanii]|uniref:hypothetical protein n=1 Tax=Chlamydia vaughanii TaxID=3112552 RepID=UPI0032B17C18
MCCPCWNSRARNGTPNPDEDCVPLTGGGGVASQPKKREADSTAARTQSAVGQILNPPSQSPSTSSCCPQMSLSWMRSCFQCLRSCFMPTPEGQHPFLKKMHEIYGPMVTQNSLGTCSQEIKNKLDNHDPLTREEKHDLEKLFLNEKGKLEKEHVKPLQESLFLVANNPETLPNPESEEVKAVKWGYDSQKCYVPPVVRVIVPMIDFDRPREQQRPEEKVVDFVKLENQLKLIAALDLESEEKDPLGQQGVDVSSILQNACLYLVYQTPPPQEGNSELVLTEMRFLQLILLSMLSLRKVPLDLRGRAPRDTMPMLIELMNKLREHAKSHSDKPKTLVEGAEEKSKDVDGWLSPEQQEKLLKESEKTHKSSKGILWD